MKDYYLSESIVTCVMEVAPGKFVAGVWGEAFVAFIQRNGRLMSKIKCPMPTETQCTDLLPVPDFDFRVNPFILVRNCRAVNLLDLKNMQLIRLSQIPNHNSAYSKMKIAGKWDFFKLVFVTKQGSIEEIKIERNFFDHLRQIGNRE